MAIKIARKKLYIYAGIISSIILALLILITGFESKPENRIENHPLVLGSEDVARIQKGTFSREISISGVLYPLQQTTAIAEVAGLVAEIYVRPGETVKKNQILAELNPADLIQAVAEKEAALDSARSSYQLALLSEQRYKLLLAKKFYAQNDYDTAINQVRVTAANIKQAEASLSEAKLQLHYATITSMITGIVSERDIDPGVHVNVGATLFKVVNLDHLELRAVVPASQISQITKGQKAYFRVDGIDRSFVGNVVRVSPSSIASTRAYYAYIHMKNPDHILLDGMFATGHIVVMQHFNALLLPAEAIRHDPKGDYVYRVKNGIIEKCQITLGLIDEARDLAEVKTGILNGDVVIISNIDVVPKQKALLPKELQR